MMIAPRATSDPVPLVVGMAIKGATRSVISPDPPSIVAKVLSDPSSQFVCVAAIATPLAQSMAEPPPTAIKPSQLFFWYCKDADITAASVGLDGVWSKTSTLIPPN